MSDISGKTFVLIGSFSANAYQFEVAELITNHGGVVKNFIDASVDFVIVGGKTEKSSDMEYGYKLHYAKKYGVTVLTERELEIKIRAKMAGDERRSKEAQTKLAIDDYGTW